MQDIFLHHIVVFKFQVTFFFLQNPKSLVLLQLVTGVRVSIINDHASAFAAASQTSKYVLPSLAGVRNILHKYEIILLLGCVIQPKMYIASPFFTLL